jgi:hypothetical protein
MLAPISRRVHLLALVVAATAALLVGRAAEPALAAEPGAESDFVARINAARTQRGLPAYRIASDLIPVARRHAQRMAARGSGPFHNDNLANEAGDGWRRLGENVGVGPEVATLHDAFMASPGHRANILHADFSEVALGVVIGGDGRMWVVEVFRQPAGAARAPAPPPAPAAAPRPAPAAVPAPAPAAPPRRPPAAAPRPPAPTTTTTAAAPVSPAATVAVQALASGELATSRPAAASIPRPAGSPVGPDPRLVTLALLSLLGVGAAQVRAVQVLGVRCAHR